MCLFLIFGLVSFHAGHAKLGINRILAKNFTTADKERFFRPQDNLFGEEGLVGVHCGADEIAASALGTGVAVKQLLPGELLGLGNPVIFPLFDVLDEGQGPLGFVATEEDVEGSGHQVQMLGAWQVDQEAEYREDMQPPEDAVPDDIVSASLWQCCPKKCADRGPGCSIAGCILKGFHQDQRDDDSQNQAQDDVAIPGAVQEAEQLAWMDHSSSVGEIDEG